MRLIDADALINRIVFHTDWPTDEKEAFEDEINAEPTITPECEMGKWDFIGDNMLKCTCCGTPYTTQQLNGLRNYDTDPYAPKFCPNCGAKMEGTEC